MSRPASDLPERAVQAAIELAGRTGVRNVTFDAVAERIGASKGAVLHHFRTKGALLDAMVTSLLAVHREALDAARAADPEPVGAFARALLAVASPADRMTERGLLSILLEEPERVGAVHAYWRWCHERLAADGLTPGQAALIMLASDGAWYTELLGLPMPSSDAMAEGRSILDAMTRRNTPESMQ
jgi:AcrR family transcriptional regulator